METVALPPFMQRRPSAYYYRRAVPPELQQAIGKRELVVSLKTLDLRTAKKQYAAVNASVEDQLDLARLGLNPVAVVKPFQSPMADSDGAASSFIAMATASYFDRLERDDIASLVSVPPDDIQEACHLIEVEAGHYLSPESDWRHVQPTARKFLADTGFPIEVGSDQFWRFCIALNGAHLEHLKRAYRRVAGQPSPFDHRPTGYVQDAVLVTSTNTGRSELTVKDLIERFDGDPSRKGIRAKTKESAGAPAKRLLLEVAGANRPASTIDRETVREIRRILIDLAPRSAQRFPGMPMKLAAAKARDLQLPALSTTTVNNQMIWVSAILSYAEREQFIPSNPARQMAIPKDGRGKGRPPWSVTDLNTLFAHPNFTEPNPSPGRFWVPLLALFQGCRENEACLLFSDDIAIVDGVPTVRFTPDESRKKDTKTNSARVVPIHRTLLDLGFLSFAQSLQSAEPKPLFPELTRDRHGSATNAFSKWFKRLMTDAGIATSGLVFHSLRHSFTDALRRAGVSEERSDALGGWKTNGSARRGYGRGFEPADLVQDLNRVQYPGLDLKIRRIHAPEAKDPSSSLRRVASKDEASRPSKDKRKTWITRSPTAPRTPISQKR